ncbi:DapH/DapD/GlmU-related protein [Luteolibacter algae]|uniref:DapH/DapD/GlmU-related protein n=1 Tax=Luteolibacter algae TaxID=454151 RepID=A0ABW5D4Y7_9BACT
MKIFDQKNAFSSPWSRKEKVMMLLWGYVWMLLCSWTPKPFNKWRIFWLRFFGAKISGRPFVHQRARIQIPWNLTMHDHACLGDGAIAYSLGEIEIHKFATVAQEAYLCTGSHAFEREEMNLITAKITIGTHSFIGARAFILPGIEIGDGAVVGACSVVTKSVDPYKIIAGNPAKIIGNRKFATS